MNREKARHVRGILDGLLQKWEGQHLKKGTAVMEAFKAAAEEETKKHARPASLKKGTLLIIVENSPWLYKLTLEKKVLLKKFNESYTGRKKAKDIRIRIGTLEDF